MNAGAPIRARTWELRVVRVPDLIAQELLDWCERHGVDPRHIQPGKPDQNAFVERFLEEVLDAYVVEDLKQVRELSAEWLRMYNEERPQDALGRQPPVVFRALIEAKTNSISELSTDEGLTSRAVRSLTPVEPSVFHLRRDGEAMDTVALAESLRRC